MNATTWVYVSSLLIIGIYVFMTAGAANGEVDVLGGGDLKSHVASDEFEAVVGADEPAFQVSPESGSAGRAHRRRVRDVCAHHNRLTAPMPFRAGLFAGGLAGLPLLWLAGALGRGGGGSLAVAAFARGRPTSRLASIGVVARWRTRTGRRVLARTVGQQTRQLMQTPRQFLELLARHRREVGPLDIVQVGVELARHTRRRILFAPTRKPCFAILTATDSASFERCTGECERLR